jgi:hypothetical protein
VHQYLEHASEQQHHYQLKVLLSPNKGYDQATALAVLNTNFSVNKMCVLPDLFLFNVFSAQGDKKSDRSATGSGIRGGGPEVMPGSF